jgi:hypothetical protein
MDTWEIGLSPWIIMDGNYSDFRRGQIAKFAVECGFRSVAPVHDVTSRHAVPLHALSGKKEDAMHSAYRVDAEVAFAAEYKEIVYGPKGPTPPPYDENGEPIFTRQPLVRKEVPRMMYVLDFGIRAYHHTPERFAVMAGDYVTAEIGGGIDPFFYFVRLHKIPGMPPLIYTWYIDRIRFFSGPLIETRDENGRRMRVHDMERVTVEDVERTHAQGNTSNWYILHCTRLDAEPEVMDWKMMQAWYRGSADLNWQ